MEIKQLNTFKTVANTLSFSKTAQVLNFAQSSISDQIKSLEEELNCKLFERLGRSISLTTEGEVLLEYAVKILELTDEAKQTLNHSMSPTGTLTVATAETLGIYLLPKLFTEYSKRYPDVDLKIVVGKCEEFPNWIKTNKVDISYTFDSEIRNSDMNIMQLLNEPLVIVSEPSNFPLKNQITLKDLEGMNMALTQSECSYRSMFEDMLEHANVLPGMILDLESIEAIKQYILNGFGITFLPLMAVKKDLENGTLKQWKYKGFTPFTKAEIVLHKNKWISPAVKALLNLTNEMIINPLSDNNSSQSIKKNEHSMSK